MINVVQGDLLLAKEKIIVHQCNCRSSDAKGLAKLIFDKYPAAYTYDRQRQPGTYHAIHTDDKVIVNLYGQLGPGKPNATNATNATNDTPAQRLTWFTSALYQIYGVEELAMPYNIGCGMAGGNWSDYFSVIEKFAKDRQINVVLYRQ